MNTRLLAPALFAFTLALGGQVTAADHSLHTFKKQQLEKYYWSEGAALGDLNHDGKPDAVSGPYWWEGPDFTKRHEIYAPKQTTKTKKDGKDVEFPGFEGNFGSKNAYSTDNFFAFIYDFNGDGWNDVLTYGLPNTPAFLYLNPKGKEQHWERFAVLDHVDNESPTFTDITGDGKPEIICNYEGNFGYATPDWSNPTAKWTFHPITRDGKWQRFTHGLGVGDINGDGRLDIIFSGGWLEQPASLAGDPAWKFHKVNFAPAAAQMYAYDVNGDGRADVITALAAHGYGLAWHEQLAEKDADGAPKWRSHVFMHKEPAENRYGIHFSELHAVELFDVDGDGLKDIVTGNCYWAHGPAVAPGAGEEGVLYWFKLVRNADKSVDWVPHLIDSASGVGRQIGTGDVNGDGKTDLIIGNKLGTFVFTHEAKKVSADEWAKAQPPVKFASFNDQPLEKMSVIVHTTRPNGTPAVVQPATKGAAGVSPQGQAAANKKDRAVMYTRTFKFDVTTLKSRLESIIGKRTAAEDSATKGGIVSRSPTESETTSNLLAAYLKSKGLDFVAGQSDRPSVYLNESGSVLTVRAPLLLLDKFEQELQDLLSYSVLASAREGIIPTGKDGQPLNLNFESGTLKDWTATGNAFNKQPIRGDTVAKRLAGSGRTDRSLHEGDYWIGGYEALGDKPTGTLSSVPFKVTHPWASFLFAGGNLPGTRLELVRADSQQVIFTARGVRRENLVPMSVDLQPHAGKEIFIRLVDEETVGWGHINFDDFRFHAEKPVFAALGSAGASPAVRGASPRTSGAIGGAPTAAPGAGALPKDLPPVDDFKFAGLKPEEAAREMTLPPGFKAHLFAGEPDVRNPIAFCLDDRGRVWVVEGLTYPQRAPEGQGKDRILVFEDTDGDGKFDKRTVFMEGLNLVSGIEYGFGGVWVGAAPYLYFIPIAEGDSPKPAGKPQVVLEGFGYQDTHETLNTFRWGPDGWLYGCHGVFTHSHVKPAGAPDTERQFINAGIWRFHPTKKKFEVFAEGTSNPWGMDFDERGQILMEGCVIPHLWHMIQGARYHRQGGQHYLPSHDEIQRNDPDYFKQDFSAKTPRPAVNPYVYDDIKTIADHFHYAGKTPHAGNNRSASAGGGHAHAGLMVYLGGSWPEQYRGKLFMNNIHGARMNMDIPERASSGFVGKHGADFLIANDKASQMLDMRYDQDGSVYVIDWYDLNQCHRPDRAAHDYDTGRIFKIVYGDTKTTKVDLQKKSARELIECLVHPNHWFADHARRILQERASRNELTIDDRTLLRVFVSPSQRFALPSEALWVANTNAESKLQLIWAMHVTRELYEEDILMLLRHGVDARAQLLVNGQDATGSVQGATDLVRAWLIQLACEEVTLGARDPYHHPTGAMFKELGRLAREDKSPVVRLYLASAAQRLPVEQRWDILAGLTSHAEDAEDHNLPLMAWYAGEPLVTADLNRALDLALNAKLPNYLAFTARRAASLGTSDAMSALVKAVSRVTDETKQLAILRGMGEALRGQRTAPVPAGWDAIASKLAGNPALRGDVNTLSAKFGSLGAFASLREQLLDPKADTGARASALDALLNSKDPSLAPSLQRLLGDEALRGQAVRALASYDDAWTPWLLLAVYKQFNPAEQRDALATLAARPAYARVLVGGLEQKTVAARDLTAETVRQIRSLNQRDLNTKLDELWGAVRESPADKLKEIERYKKIYVAGYSTPGDARRGRVLFNKTCGQCHTLFETGGKVGPDLTGSNRGDLEYILHNIIDPNAEIPNDYRASTVEMKDDRSIMGIIKLQDAKSVTLLTATETNTFPRAEIKSIRQSEISMMPEGLLTPLTDQEVRDLIFYLRSPGQVPLPKGGQ